MTSEIWKIKISQDLCLKHELTKKSPSNLNTLQVGGGMRWTALESSDIQSHLEFQFGRPRGRGQRQWLRLWHIDDRSRLRLRLLLFHDRRWNHFHFFLWTGDRTTRDGRDTSQNNRSWSRTWRWARDNRGRSRARNNRGRSRARDNRGR